MFNNMVVASKIKKKVPNKLSIRLPSMVPNV